MTETSRKVAIVTGGGRGIGRAICIELAKRGCNVVVNYSNSADAANKVVEECEMADECEAAIAIKADVSHFDEAKMLIDKTVECFGRVDILVNNAGITKDGLIIKMTEEDFESVLKINLGGAFNCTKHASAQMIKQRIGSIVNISSISGVMGNAGQANYSASKAGIIGLTKAAARELARRNIRVNAVAPGFVNTDMTAQMPLKAREGLEEQVLLGRLGEPEDIAKAVAFLASDEASYITGQVLCVDGGMAI